MYSLWGHIVGSSHCKNKQTRGYCLTSDCATCVIQRETSLKDQVQHKELIRPKFIITYRAENGEHCWKYLLHFWHLRNVLFPFQAPKNLQSVLDGQSHWKGSPPWFTRLHWVSWLWHQSRTRGPAHHWVLTWQGTKCHRVTQVPWGTSDRSPGPAGDTLSPAPARNAKPVWKKPR